MTDFVTRHRKDRDRRCGYLELQPKSPQSKVPEALKSEGPVGLPAPGSGIFICTVFPLPIKSQ
jgi:hypothetical protein